MTAVLPSVPTPNRFTLTRTRSAPSNPPSCVPFCRMVSAMARVMASELAPWYPRVRHRAGAIETPSWGLDRLDATTRAEHVQHIGER